MLEPITTSTLTPADVREIRRKVAQQHPLTYIGDVPALCDALEAAWRERDELRAERSVLRSALLNVQSTAQNARLRGV